MGNLVQKCINLGSNMSSGAHPGKHLNRCSLWRITGRWWGLANNRPAATCITLGQRKPHGSLNGPDSASVDREGEKNCFHGKSTEFGYTLWHILKHNLKSMLIQRNKQLCSAYSWIWATIWCTCLIELGALTWNRGLWQHPSAIWGKKRWMVSQINWHPKIVIWTPLLNCLNLWSWRIQTWLRHD